MISEKIDRSVDTEPKKSQKKLEGGRPMMPLLHSSLPAFHSAFRLPAWRFYGCA
jgi:hypothetical protein